MGGLNWAADGAALTYLACVPVVKGVCTKACASAIIPSCSLRLPSVSHPQVETTLALDNFRRACDCGRGAVFFRWADRRIKSQCNSRKLANSHSVPAGWCRFAP